MVKVREDIPIVSESKQTDLQHSKYFQNYAPSSSDNIDIEMWLNRLCDMMAVDELPQLTKACQLVAQVTEQQTAQDIPAKKESRPKTKLTETTLTTSTPIKDQPISVLDTKRTDAYQTGVGIADVVSYLVNDEVVLVSAMLFRARRQKLISEQTIAENFSQDVSNLVNDTLAMGKLSDMIEKNRKLEDHFNNNQKDHLSGIYKMLIAVTNDVRVVLIKLAERTFAVRQLEFSSVERKQRVAREIMTIYAPLAHRLGIAQLKWELEDLSFRYLAPIRYKEIAKLLSEKRVERESYIEKMMQTLKSALVENKINAQVDGRVKHIYSIYKKMRLKNLSFDQLYDIRAMRVLVDKKVDCYHVMGLVHELWRHIPEQFDDYITNPKANGYRSLHTAVFAENKSLEIQIRTQNMHFEAELGVCAHVNYKEGTKAKPDQFFDSKINSLRQVLASYQDKADAQDEFDDKPFQDWTELEQIYVFTKDGEIQELPKGSTVLDFAYYVHTQIGNKCAGAKVNKGFVPLTYVLKTGEQVEILTKKDREPNRDWLVASLGYIKTSRARSKLRNWLNQQDRGKNIQMGLDLFHQELVRLGLHPNSVDLTDYIQRFKVNSSEELLIALVKGDIGLNSVTKHISKQLKLEPELEEQTLYPSVHPSVTGKLDAYNLGSIGVDGLDNVEISFARCCSVVQGEPIYGFITKQRGVSIHHEDCVELNRLLKKEPERGISASWHANITEQRLVMIGVEAYDRRGLLKDLTSIIDKEKINIVQVNMMNKSDGCVFLTLGVEVIGLNQLSSLLAKLEQQPGVLSARRQTS